MKTLFIFVATLCVSLSAGAQQSVRVLTPDYALTAPLTNRVLVYSNATGKSSWICDVGVHNASGSTVYVHLFDTNSLPGAGAIPSAWHPVELPTASQASLSFPVGYPLSRGLAIGISSTKNSFTAASTNCWIAASMYRKSN